MMLHMGMSERIGRSLQMSIEPAKQGSHLVETPECPICNNFSDIFRQFPGWAAWMASRL